VVPFELSIDEILEIKDVYVGLILNYSLMPQIDIIKNNGEEIYEGYNLSYHFFNANWFKKSVMQLLYSIMSKRILRITKNARKMNE
jgi:hypothetical protein